MLELFKGHSNIFIFMVTILLSCLCSADDTTYSECKMSLSEQNIKYGQLARQSLVIDSIGDAALPKSRVQISVLCPSNVNPSFSLKGVLNANNHFNYANHGYFKIQVNTLHIDGVSKAIQVWRNGRAISTETILPDDVIKPLNTIQGKSIVLDLNITPVVNSKSIVKQNALTLDDHIDIAFAEKFTSGIQISSTFPVIACEPFVSNGGLVNFGKIVPNSLNTSTPTIIGVRTLTFLISCDANTNIALRAFSNRLKSTTDITTSEKSNGSGSANEALKAAGLGKNLPLGGDFSSPVAIGLGFSSFGEKIGGFMLTMPYVGVKLNGRQVTNKFYATLGANLVPNENTQWQKNGSLSKNGDTLISDTLTFYGYTADTTLNSPQPFKNLTGTLIIQAYITAAKNLNLNQPITLDGSATIELYYF